MKTLLKATCLLLLTLSALSGFGQGGFSEGKNQLKLSTLRLIDFVNPGIELSYERRQTARFSTQLSVGLMNDCFKLTPFTDYRGTRFSLEEKYFPKNKRSNQYYSVEAAYLNVWYKTNSYFIQDTALRTPEYNDSFQVAKKTFSLNLKYGIQIPMRRFLIDISVGIGIKYRQVKRMDVKDPKAYEVTSRHPNAYEFANKEGNYFTGNVPFNLRLGYTF